MAFRKPKAIPEESIRAKAYEIWKERKGEGGSPENDWYEAEKLLRHKWSFFIASFWKSLIFPFWLAWKLPSLFANPDSRDFALDVVKTVISALGLIATIIAGVGLFLNYLDSLEDRKLTQERLITDRFSKAVEQLGSKEEAVRLGGIYSLERIAKDSPKDHWTVIEILTSYVQKKSPLPDEIKQKLMEFAQLQWQQATELVKRGELEKKVNKLPEVSFDVQSVLTVIGRRDTGQEKKGQILNLKFSNFKEADLKGADLKGADLRGANFRGANLKGAYLTGAYLTGAYLKKANLRLVNLEIADLRGAYLERAKLGNSYLIAADLRGVYLEEADLRGADLRKANLNGADLRGALLWKVNLSRANLIGADLREALLWKANLSGANLMGADLRKALLWKANLSGAYLMGANLEGANLEGADFSESNLLGKVEGLTPEQVKSACFWEKAKYDKEFQKQLESSPPVKGVDCSKWQK